MKIRKKITIWISGTALLSTIIFSSYIFFELMEEPFRFIDKEMDYMTISLVKQMQLPRISTGQYDLSHMPYNPDQYWIKVTDNTDNTLYQSQIAKYVDIQPSGDKTTYMVEKLIPKSVIWLGQDDNNDVLFRVLVSKMQLGRVPIVVHIAKPIENLEEEVIELVQQLVASLILCTLITVLLSYKLAGKIINPVAAITRMSNEINEKSLDKRIPLNQSKDELFNLSVSLNKMFDRLQYSFARQKEFIGNASHELKSPITLLMLAQEEILMADDLTESANAKLTKQLNTTRRMSLLVRNLLDLSRLEQQETFDKNPINLDNLMKQVLNDYNELFEAKNIRIQNRIQKDLIVQGDKEKLFRLFVNLIDNSIRYNLKKDGIVIVEGKKTNQGIVLEVSNTGQRIPQKDLDRIFEQFYRVEKSRSTTHGGSGLGLAIAKKIVELHDGTILISNEPRNFIKTTILF